MDISSGNIASPGVGSGLEVGKIVDKLVLAEMKPLQAQFQRQTTSVQTRLSAISQISSAMDQLKTDMARLSNMSEFYVMKTTVSDTDYLSASATTSASPGLYQIEVKELAQRQSLASGSFASADTAVGTGSITIDFGSYDAGKTTFTANPDKTSVKIDIVDGNNSLTAIRDAINDSDSGVSATIIQDAGGARISITAPGTGAELAMKITVSDDDGNSTDASGLSSLAYDPTSGVNSMTETLEAKNASVEVNGIPLSFASNTVDSAIDGLTINLKKAEIGKIINVNIDHNTGQLKAAVSEFVKSYNSAIATLNQLTGFNKESKTGGLLQGDAGLRSLKMGLTSLISTTVGSNGNAIRSLGDIGVKTNKDNRFMLEVDDAALTKAIENNFEDIGALFAKSATVTDSDIRVKDVGGSVKAGTYDINLSEYTPGVSISGTIGGYLATSSQPGQLSGSNELSGVSINVLGGSTGARGSITIQDGLAAKFTDLLDSYLSDNGSLTLRTKNLNEQMKQLNEKAKKLDTHEAEIEARYLKQFTSLDLMIKKLRETSDFLTVQLQNLPKLTLNNK